ncbi:MAG TPA: Ig-like domain-containing protein [candidate division Zixibacteria bacterium]|nr:Ig-like domain-containing protein [candidate division Zixibacteria bacterium]
MYSKTLTFIVALLLLSAGTALAQTAAPELSPIGAQTVNENSNLNFGVSASDADATIPTLTTSTLPTGASFTDNGDGTGTFDWTPGFSDAGDHEVRFYANDVVTSDVDSEIVIITVNDVNQAPVLAAIGARSTDEGVNLNFTVSASDADGTTPTLSATNLPTGASFTDNGDGTATFDWTPTFTDAGPYSVTFTASDGSLTDDEIVAITVNDVNQAPVLAAIGARSTDEGVNLNFTVSASDADGTTPTLSATNLPTGASFTDNGDGTGTFDWTPTFTDAGPYSVTFTASDGSLTDDEIVAITVNDVNQAPVLAAIGARSTDEGVNLNFTVSASDADGTTPTLSATNLPTGASFTDNGDGTGTFDWTPTFTDAGPYSVTFTASDGSLTDDEIVAITVNDVNQAPVLAAIGARSTDEGVNLNFTVSASDADGTTPTLSATNLPTGASFTDNGDGTGTFDWTPGYTDAGSYDVTFTASDGSLTDDEIVAITVNDVNQAPVLAAIGARSTDEGVNLNFTVSASDADGTTPTLSATNLPTGASFTDNGDGTGTFDWTPTFTDAGPYSVTFTASDGSLTDDEIVAITVNDVNQAPVLAAIGARSTDEGVNLNFTVSASDADGTTPTLSATNLPTGASFTDNGDGTGTFDWTPGYTDAGSYDVTFTASDGSLTDDEIVAITVNDVNQAPVLAAIGAQSTTEDVNLNFNISATDADGTIPSFTADNLPTGATFTDNGDGTATFDWTPGYTDAGSYDVTFTASDGSLTDDEVVTITVNDAGNQAPVLAAIGARSTDEGVNLNFTVSASDADGTTPTLSATNLPTGASFTDNGDGTATFDWTPTFTDAGPYSVTFTASDGSLTDDEIVAITVNDVNQAPVLAAIGARSTDEGVNLNFTVSASDADGTTPTLSATNLPTGASFTDNGDGTGTFDWTPTFTDAGPYSVTFTASDGSLTDDEIVAITVNDVNQAPVLAAIGARSTDEGVNLSFTVSASDADGTTPTLSATNLPTGASFTDNGDGTGTFDWTPTFADAGPYSVTFTASDGSLTDDEVVTITVNDVNQAPVLAAIGAQSTTEDVNLNFNISATDADGTTPSLTADNLPTGATFTDNGDGTGTFDWTPGYTDAGSYDVTFTASDGSLTDDEVVTITVNDAGNQAPVLAAIGAQSVTEAVNLNFNISATDADGTTPSFTADNLPIGATFTDNGDGTGTFDWTPGYTDAGSYDVTFTASDGSLTDDEVVTITVNDAGNQAPVLAAIGAQSTTEDVNLNFNISATDADGTTPSFTADNLPTGATFTDNGDGTGTFDWTPGYTDAGSYDVTFTASDGSLTDDEIVTITVNDAGNQAPVLAAIGAQSTTEDVNLNFNISATDADGTTPSFTADNLPTGATFTDNGDGTGTFDWTPGYTDAGSYDVTFTASDGSLTDDEVVTITVSDAGNQAPVLAAIGAQSTTEDVNLNFNISATDADGTTPSFTADNLPTGATFTDNGDGTGTFDWTPGYTDAGSYDVTFTASDGSLTDDEVVTITVNDAGNQAPVLAAIGAQSITEDVNLNFNISATDADGTTPSFTADNLPTGATFTDNGDGTATFDWTPGYTDAGSYDVTFTASDGSLTDDEIVTITVNDAGNQAPVLAAIGAQSTTEDVNLNFNISATDADGTTPSFTADNLPTGASFTDNGDGTATFDWTPGYTDAGSYDVTFTASDGSLTDDEVVTITVNDAGNQAPVLAAIGAQSTTEDVNLNFNISATDADGTTPSFTADNLPTGATFTDNGDGTGTFDWTPGYTDAGSYDVTFTASDGSLTDDEVVTITVNDAGNQAPVLAAIGAQSTTEDVNLNFNISATDADGTTPSFTADNLPTGASFTDNGDGTGTFDWTPGYTDAGSYDVTFTASDGSLTDDEVVTITVNDAGNQAPVLAAIGAQSTTEDVNLNFNISATDADGTTPSFTADNLPTGATFTDNGDGTGTFDWTPGYTDAGSYDVTFTASDGTATDDEVVTITVNDAGNQAPVLAAIGSQLVVEAINLNFTISATDPDATIPSFTADNLPTGATFTDNGDGTGTFDWTPGYTDAGSYDVTFTASDGSLTDDEVVTITVNDAGNQAPVLAAIGAQSTTEDVNLNFNISATDADGTTPSFTADNLPTGATFTDNGDGTATFDWTPGYTDAGSYDVTFTASDGTATDDEVVTITVNDAGNQVPVLAAIGAQSTTENILLNFAISATDPDATIPTLTATNLPTGATFTDNGDGTGTFDWTPAFGDAGTYNVTFTASDGELTIDEIVEITVLDNQAPVLDEIGSQFVVEGATLSLPTSASDPDGTIPVLTVSALPSGATYTDNGDGTGLFEWITDPTMGGVYTITFYASDGELEDFEDVVISVSESGNHPPTITAIDDTTVFENGTLAVAVTAEDIDADPLALSVSTHLQNYTFVDNGDGTGLLTYTPDYFDAGLDTVKIYATELGSQGLVALEIFSITTVDVNQPPVIDSVGPFTVDVDDVLEFEIVATDSDEDSTAVVFLSIVGSLPTNASFVDNGDNTGSFSFTPEYGQEGDYTITFLAIDQGSPQLSSTRAVDITVNGINIPPVLDSIGTQKLYEGETLLLNLSATDIDGTEPPTFSTDTLYENMSLVDNGDGTAVFTFTPSFLQAGLYSIKFRAFDGHDYDREVVLIQVREAGNQAPYFDQIPAGLQVVEGTVLTDVVYAVDPELGTISISLVDGTVPNNFYLIDNGDGSAGFQFSPDYTQQGVYDIGLEVTDGELSSQSTLSIEVVDAGNQDPVLDPIGDKTVDEHVALTFSITTSDPDGDYPVITSSTLPGTATLVDNGNGTANFAWTPTYDDAGEYPVTFYATDAAEPSDVVSEEITITVVDINRAPWYFMSPFQQDTLQESETLTYEISAWDDDGTLPDIVVTLDGTDTLATNMEFTSTINGTNREGTLTFSPDYTQGDNDPDFYYVRFSVHDEMNYELTRSEVVTFRVYDKNEPPHITVNDPGPITINEGGSVDNLAALAEDNDGTVTLTVDGLPDSNYTLSQPATYALVFNFFPDYNQAGTYQLRYIAVDNDGAADTLFVDIIVLEAGNQSPYWEEYLPSTVTVYVDQTFDTTLVAIDPEGLPVTLTMDVSIPNANFVVTDNTGVFSITADPTQNGESYPVTFTVTDSESATDVMTTTFVVATYLRGDTDGNLKFTINDVIYLAAYMFRQGTAPAPLESADADASGQVDVSDIAYMVNFLYHSGPRPPQ